MGFFEDLFEGGHRRRSGHHDDHRSDHHRDHDHDDDLGHRAQGQGYPQQGPIPPPFTAPPAVTTCPSCRATLALAPGFRFCPECGVRLGTPPSCRACGAATQPGAKFCQGCGANL